MHTFIHTYLPTYLLTYLHIYLPSYLPACLPTYLRTYVPTYAHTHIRTYTHTHIRTYIHAHIRTYIRVYIYIYIHMPLYYMCVYFLYTHVFCVCVWMCEYSHVSEALPIKVGRTGWNPPPVRHPLRRKPARWPGILQNDQVWLGKSPKSMRIFQP